MLNSLPIRLLWHSLNWLTRLTIVASAVLAVLIGLSIVVLRYWVLPDIERYHGEIEASLSQAIGSPVKIARIEADWQSLHPRMKFDDVRILDERNEPALVLPYVEGRVSWLSLPTLDLRMARLEVQRPEILIRRDAAGRIELNGLAFSGDSEDNDLADWLLRQSNLTVRDALFVWMDDKRAAPPLVLRQVNLRAESFFSHHEFALRALPPAELATPMDLRGDFRGDSFDDLKAWHGRLYTRLDYTDVTAWRPWLDLPDEFSRGRGALRGWMEIGNGQIEQVTADIDLRDVLTRLALDLPQMDVMRLRGRAGWRNTPDELAVTTHHLSLRLRDGTELPSTDFHFRLARAGGKLPPGGEVRANLLRLETLAGLSKFLPLDASMRKKLEAYAPRGKVSGLDARWEGGAAQPDSYRIKGRFEEMALRRVGAMPGISGLTFEIDGSDEAGKLHLDAHRLWLEAPDELREPLSFTRMAGQAEWRRQGGETEISVGKVAFENNDVAGDFSGSYRTQAGTKGVLDLTVALTRGDVRRAARYTPLLALDREENDWLAGALLAGQTDDFRVRIKGNLSDFPLKGGEKEALLEIGGHARGVVLEFDPAWPRIEGIDGEFWIRGKQLEVRSDSATTLGARLRNVSAVIADINSDDLPLEFKGTAEGASDAFLRYVRQSPVREYTNHLMDGMRAGGDGHLDLKARIPLQGDGPVTVAGRVQVVNNALDLGEGMPLLRDLRGELEFTEAGVRTRGVTTQILGGPAQLEMRNEADGVLHVTAKGRSNLEVLRTLAPNPLLERLSGGASWDAEIKVVKGAAELLIRSDLRGIASTLPQPFAKRATDMLPLRLEKRNVTAGQDVISAKLGALLDARLARRETEAGPVVERGMIHFGGEGKWPDKEGVWFSGRIPELSMQGWSWLAGGGTVSSPALTLAGGELQIDRLTGYGQNLRNVHIEASQRKDSLVARLNGTFLNGELSWSPHGYNGGPKLGARLRRLEWKLGGSDLKPSARPPAAAPQQDGVSTAGSLPALDLSIDNLRLGGKEIGRFDLVGHPEGANWRLRRLNIVNPDGSLSGDGLWRNGRTQVRLQLDISDAGNILARSGYPDTVRKGSGKLVADLAWRGDPDDYNYATLDGTLHLDTGKGQFLKMDPGAGKLLGILSLQALPRRITLDFTDVFSEGFQFETIRGTATVKAGVIETQDLQINGSSAKVTMKGRVDLDRETQDLRVRVLPSIGESVSLLGAFAAGPAVGIGTLIASKVLGDPLDKLVSFEYNVSGTWRDPHVVKLGRVPVEKNPHE